MYPYEYIDDVSRFNDIALPPIAAFYSSLTKISVNSKEYEHAQRVWQHFGCQNLGDYHDLYLITVIILIAHVVVNCVVNWEGVEFL